MEKKVRKYKSKINRLDKNYLIRYDTNNVSELKLIYYKLNKHASFDYMRYLHGNGDQLKKMCFGSNGFKTSVCIKKQDGTSTIMGVDDDISKNIDAMNKIFEKISYGGKQYNNADILFLGKGGFGLVLLVKKDELPMIAVKLIKKTDNEITKIIKLNESKLNVPVIQYFFSINCTKTPHFHKKNDMFYFDGECNLNDLTMVVYDVADGDLTHLLGELKNDKNIIPCYLKFIEEFIRSQEIGHKYFIHGDIKPRNIFYKKKDSGYEFMLGDFSFSRICENGMFIEPERLEGSHHYLDSYVGISSNNVQGEKPFDHIMKLRGEGKIYKISFLMDVQIMIVIAFVLKECEGLETCDLQIFEGILHKLNEELIKIRQEPEHKPVRNILEKKFIDLFYYIMSIPITETVEVQDVIDKLRGFGFKLKTGITTVD